jgi:hypothetical protein
MNKKDKITPNRTKLDLLHFLSGPKIKIDYWQLHRDTCLSEDTNGWVNTSTTGTGTITIQFREKTNE